MQDTPILSMLHDRQPIDLIWLSLGSPAIAEIAAQARPGAIVIDMQHDLWDRASLEAAVGVVRNSTRVIVRCADDLLLAEMARHLALWMSYEDTVRVAELKIRATRFARVRDEVKAAPEQLLHIDEFLHPRVEEIADTLPATLGRWLLKPGPLRSMVERMTSRGRVVRTTSLRGFLMLYGVASLRGTRRRSLRYQREQVEIDAWLARTLRYAAHDYALALEIARSQRLVKGYGDTHARGIRNYREIEAVLPLIARTVAPAARLKALCEAALADEEGVRLDALLDELRRNEDVSNAHAGHESVNVARAPVSSATP